MYCYVTGKPCEITGCTKDRCSIAAHYSTPIIQPIQEVEVDNEDELWNEAIEEIKRVPYWKDVPEYCKTHFTIQRK